jgi:hypothetical protein
MSNPTKIGVTNLEGTPYCIEWAASQDSEDWYVAYFSSRSEADNFAKAKSGDQCVWQSEIGDYEDANGKPTRSWLYYSWNQRAYELTAPERDKGYLVGGEELVAYRPWRPER